MHTMKKINRFLYEYGALLDGPLGPLELNCVNYTVIFI